MCVDMYKLLKQRFWCIEVSLMIQQNITIIFLRVD